MKYQNYIAYPIIRLQQNAVRQKDVARKKRIIEKGLKNVTRKEWRLPFVIENVS